MAHEISVPDGTKWPEAVSYDASGEDIDIMIGQGGSATIIITARGSVSIRAQAKKDAVLNLVCLQTEDAIIKQVSSIGDSATINVQNISLAPVEHELVSRIEGKHARSNIDWVFYARGTEQQQLKASNVFEGEEGSGEIILKGVAEDAARVFCSGTINIGVQGKGTDTYLTEEVLMLDKTAKVDAVPGLEIKTNDVKASHSATVSRVTPDDLFYFASRGIAEREARKMFVVGFLGDTVSKIADTKIQSSVLQSMEEKYGV